MLYGPSICTRSVQMDLRRNQVRRPFPTPGSGTLWVSGESLRHRRVSCLPRWTVCPTRSPPQDTNRSTCRGECSWSGPLATPPGRCHLGLLANGPGRNPPYCLRSDGADMDTGGAPKPQRSGTSPASFAGSCHPGPPPRSLRCWSLPPRFRPQGRPPVPRLLPCSLAPAMSRMPLLSAPALACWCPLLFVFFFVSPPGVSVCPLPPPHVPSLSPRCPRPFRGWVEELGAGAGGVLAVHPIAQARRKHGACTRRGTCPSAGGGGLPCGSRRHPTFPAVAPPVVPPLGLARRVLPLGTVVWSVPHSRSTPSPPCRGVLGGGSAFRYRHPPCPLAVPSLPPPLSLVGVGVGGGEGGASPLSFLRRKHVSGTALAGGAALVLLPGSGARRVAPVAAHPTLRSLPRCPPRWGLHGACFPRARSCGPSRTLSPLPPHLAALSSGGGAAVRPSLPASPTLGGAEVCVGGGGLSSSLRCTHAAGSTQARRRHETRHPSLCRGGGACLAAPLVALSTLRSHPRWSPRRGLHGACPLRARSCGSSRTLLPPPPHPAALSSGGGGGRFTPPPTRIPRPREAGVGGGGRGALVVSPSLHARRRHDVGTTQARGKALGCCGGGGGFPLGLPALLHGIGPAAQDHQPLLPLGGSRHVSAWCSVSRACSLLRPYLLEEVRTRVETEDDEVRAAGRTYRTPRRLLAPSAALVEGGGVVLAPNSPGGAGCPSSPWCPCIHFRAA